MVDIWRTEEESWMCWCLPISVATGTNPTLNMHEHHVTSCMHLFTCHQHPLNAVSLSLDANSVLNLLLSALGDICLPVYCVHVLWISVTGSDWYEGQSGDWLPVTTIYMDKVI